MSSMDERNENSGLPDYRRVPEDQGTNWDRYPASEPDAAGRRDGRPHEGDPFGVGPAGTDPYAVGPGGSDPYGTVLGGPDPYAADATASDPSPYGPVSTGPTGPPAGHLGHGLAGGPLHPGYPGGTYAVPPPTSGMAVTGFVLALLSYILCPGVLAPVGLIFSILGMRETSARRDVPRTGRGLAIAGLVLSVICFALLVLVVVLAIVLSIFTEPS